MKGTDRNSMTAKEIDRLNDWLISKGHTPEEARQCIKHIATGQNLQITPTKKEAHRRQRRKLNPINF